MVPALCHTVPHFGQPFASLPTAAVAACCSGAVLLQFNLLPNLAKSAAANFNAALSARTGAAY